MAASLSPSAINVNYNANEANRAANQAMMQAAKKVLYFRDHFYGMVFVISTRSVVDIANSLLLSSLNDANAL